MVPPTVYKVWGDRSIYFLDPRMVALADFVRDFFKAEVLINNWNIGGDLYLRGYRPPDTKTGGYLSQHKFGRAFDCNIDGYTPEEVYETIIKNERQFMIAGLTVMEDVKFTPSWNHLDVRWTGNDFIQIVKP